MEGGFATTGGPCHPFLMKDTNALQKISLSLYQVYLIHIKVWSRELGAL